ncbi:MAG: FAD-binding oxidoreductase [SAR202 cluster bacterium]|jgi:glycine/D-amino acid oxidase-like deaminating enzyme|nr:FAD-binding oxidoreductase [SAR202 cluster bacterium]
MTTTADAVVIGGGVMGASILHSLTSKGVKNSILLERSTIGSGSTGRSSGAIRMHYSTEVNARLALESLQIFANFDEIVGGDVGFVETGYMVFAPDHAREGFLENIEMQRSVGIDTRVISLDEARELGPAFRLDEDEHFAWESHSGHADPSATASAYISKARSLGAQVILDTPVLNLQIGETGTHRVVTEKESFEAPTVVIATGPWSGDFLSKLGIDLPLLSTRHEVFLLKRDLDTLPTHPGGGDMTNLTYFRPEGRDLTLVGNGNHEEVVNPDYYNPRYTLSYAQEVWERLANRIPDIEKAELFTGYSGLYTTTPDLHPIIDNIDGIGGLYLCTGFSGHGFKLSPAVGEVVSELIMEGTSKTIDILPLRMNRFSEGELNETKYTFKVIA